MQHNNVLVQIFNTLKAASNTEIKYIDFSSKITIHFFLSFHILKRNYDYIIACATYLG